jgi:nucleotide-binding universal stress UspA family protein
MKVLLAVENSDFSKRAVESVGNRLWHPNTEIKILSVVSPISEAGAETWLIGDVVDEEEVAKFRHLVREYTALLTANDSLKITAEVKIGDPRKVIVEEAETWQADEIIVGSHGYDGWQKLWKGSVSEYVVANAKCSVEVVRKCKSR